MVSQIMRKLLEISRSNIICHLRLADIKRQLMCYLIVNQSWDDVVKRRKDRTFRCVKQAMIFCVIVRIAEQQVYNCAFKEGHACLRWRGASVNQLANALRVKHPPQHTVPLVFELWPHPKSLTEVFLMNPPHLSSFRYTIIARDEETSKLAPAAAPAPALAPASLRLPACANAAANGPDALTSSVICLTSACGFFHWVARVFLLM